MTRSVERRRQDLREWLMSREYATVKEIAEALYEDCDHHWMRCERARNDLYVLETRTLVRRVGHSGRRTQWAAVQPYKPGDRLRHHAGSTWEVVSRDCNGGYTIKCLVGTVRPGWRGGEVEGTIRPGFHAAYLHGDGWLREEDAPSRSVERSQGGVT